jgi:dTDP-4-amino-4,6-dideoxygalactose transaminase
MIPFLDLKMQYHSIKDEIDTAILNLLESTQFVLGREVTCFEEEFAEYSNVSYAIGVNSGTSALHLALLAGGIGPGDEVITVPNTFVATVAAICYVGAFPVFVDIDPVTYTIDPDRIVSSITEKTKAIIPVHLYGQPADMDPILDIARCHKLLVIEDAAQAHGAEYKGRRVGSMGDIGCFSFYPGKNLGACGEGGMVVTDNPEYDRTVRMLRDWGAEKKYEHKLKGFNYRMEGIQGAVLRVKLRYLEKWTKDRRSRAALYDSFFADSGILTPTAMPYARHVYHIYAVRIPNRTETQNVLNRKGIQTNIHYPFPVHLLEAYADLGYKFGDFPNAEKAAKEVLSLPMFAELTDESVEYVAQCLSELVK